MRFYVDHPVSAARDGVTWFEPARLTEFVRAAESAGIDAITLTGHPAPSSKWLDNGGHSTIDPFVGLGFIATAATTIGLMTNLIVVPYRSRCFWRSR